MTGYQEILTDPCYCRQIVTLTYPHIGNYGVNAEDVESPKVHAAGLIIRDLPLLASNFRAEQTLDALPAARERRRHRRHRHAQAHAHPAREGRAERLHRAPGDESIEADARRRAGARLPGPGRHGPRQGRQRATKPYEWTRGRMGAGQAATVTQTTPQVPRRRLRLRRQAQHPAHARRARLPRHRGAGADPGRRGAGAEARRRLPLQRPRRSGALRLRDRGDRANSSRRGMPTFGICLGHQIMAPGLAARKTLQDEVRPSRRQPSGEGPRHRPGARSPARTTASRSMPTTLPANAARHARLAVRRHAAGPGPHRRAGVLLPGPSGGEPGPARRRLPVRPLHRVDDGKARS